MGAVDSPPRELVEFILADRFKWSLREIAEMPSSKMRKWRQILSLEAQMSKVKASD